LVVKMQDNPIYINAEMLHIYCAPLYLRLLLLNSLYKHNDVNNIFTQK